MIRKNISKLYLILAIAITGEFAFAQVGKISDDRFISYIADPQTQNVQLYWKYDKQENFKSILNLKTWLERRHQKLLFAMNGGMYRKDNSPQGLFIENQQVLRPLDTSIGTGNFYLKPNGVFYITTKNIPVVCSTTKFDLMPGVNYATQSGPMLVLDGQINPAFKQGSTNMNIRNGVGILPDNRIIFAMSKEDINFYDFADYFKKLGCQNALYLDGLVSRTYLPEKHWVQTDGNFGVIIGVTDR